jgi:site-specific DNA recombinase
MGIHATRAVTYGRESQAKSKSIRDQLTLAAKVVAEQGWDHIDSYDDGSSAWRHATKARPGWQRLRADMAAHRFDVLVLWEASRGSRDMAEWTTVLDTCQDHGVRIHLVGDDRTFNPRNPSDRKALLVAGVDAEYETGRLSDRTQRGIEDAVKAGRPPMGFPPYGYRRIYDERTGELVGQEPDPEAAAHVVHAFERVAEGASISGVARELGWTHKTTRGRLHNPAYAGLRIHRRHGRNGDGKGRTSPGAWPAIVSPELFYTVQAILDSHQGAGRRPGRQRHLMSSLGTCYRDHPLRIRGERHYSCRQGCVEVSKDELDELVEAVVLEALASPKVYRNLRQAGERSEAEAQAARDELARLKAEQAEVARLAGEGKLSVEALAAFEAAHAPRIEAAEEATRSAGVPPALRGFIEPGTDVETRWEAAELGAKRDVIRALVKVVVQPVGRRGVPVADRVTITPAEL